LADGIGKGWYQRTATMEKDKEGQLGVIIPEDDDFRMTRNRNRGRDVLHVIMCIGRKGRRREHD
jgi:hypothetical protein